MKRLLLISTILLLFAGCEKDEREQEPRGATLIIYSNLAMEIVSKDFGNFSIGLNSSHVHCESITTMSKTSPIYSIKRFENVKAGQYHVKYNVIMSPTHGERTFTIREGETCVILDASQINGWN